MTEKTREKMIGGAASLLSQRGLQGTSFSEVLELTDTPRGSIYHHFPGGKDELVAEAIALLGSVVAQRITETEADRPEQVAEAFAQGLREFVQATDLKSVCVMSAVTVGAGADSEGLLPAVAAAFASWRDALADAYAQTGLGKADSRRLALTSVAALEGAMIVARAEQSMEPFDAVQKDLIALARAGNSQLKPGSRRSIRLRG
ncbi:MAG: TetR/AcrR family transcriptional regulator [Solirubrobacterales bacterium]